ncbi:MAG TPA: TetR family transcriptional regulator [Gaiellales bacterium]|nr:TetR family transcriptional regulator [Gaiellales bacterium]
MGDRRRLIVEAALRVIARDGVNAATHRAVAAEAGVALASTTYHFASKAEIVAEALELAIDRSIAAVEGCTAPPHPATPAALVDRLVELVEALCADDQAPLAAQYELLIEAGRSAELRPVAERWDGAYMGGLRAIVAAAGIPGPDEAADILSDLIEGALLDLVSFPREGFAEGALRPRIARTVAGLAAT